MGASRFGCGIEGRTMTFFDDGQEKITTSTWDQCGRAVAALLSLKWYPEDENDKDLAIDRWANTSVNIASFRVSQKDMFESVKRVTGTTDSDWKIEHVSSDERYQEALRKMSTGDLAGFTEQMYTRIFFPTGEGDQTKNLANKALELPEEDIDESTREGMRLDKLGLLTFRMS